LDRTSRIYVAGGETLLGSALIDRLQGDGYCNLVGVPPDEPDLTAAGPVEDFFAEARPEFVFIAAGQSGGIEANRRRPADLMLHNLLAATHVIDASHRYGVTKLLYLASSCSYPKGAGQPLDVASLLTGPLEPTSEAYALAKLAGLKLCQAYRRQYGDPFITAIPANSFGPGDDFSLENGHVIPALLRRFHETHIRGDRQVTVWGTGTPRREFVYAPDLADACRFVMQQYDSPEPINLGGGSVLSIAETAHAVAQVVGYRGRIEFDPRRSDGMPFKGLDSSRLRALGWEPRVPFRQALTETYDWFLRNAITEDAAHGPALV
jgi:GDP-L-fucose synthase